MFHNVVRRCTIGRTNCVNGRIYLRKKPILEVDYNYIINLYYKQNKKCAISNIQMTHKYNNLSSISIDRINSNIGYVDGNVQLVCKFINLAKGNKKDEYTKSFVRTLINGDITNHDSYIAESCSKATRSMERSYDSYIRSKIFRVKPCIYDVTPEYVLTLLKNQNYRCIISGVLMTHKFNYYSTVSIDRINNKLGYIKGNIQLVCQFINLGKNVHTNAEVAEFLQKMKEVN